MLAQQISYHLGLEGPSFLVDTACASSNTAFLNACRAIEDGVCENAIVGGSTLCFEPLISLQFARYLSAFFFRPGSDSLFPEREC